MKYIFLEYEIRISIKLIYFISIICSFRKYSLLSSEIESSSHWLLLGRIISDHKSFCIFLEIVLKDLQCSLVNLMIRMHLEWFDQFKAALSLQYQCESILLADLLLLIRQ